MLIKLVKIHKHEMGLHFHDGEFRGLLETGRHWFFDPLGRVLMGPAIDDLKPVTDDSFRSTPVHSSR